MEPTDLKRPNGTASADAPATPEASRRPSAAPEDVGMTATQLAYLKRLSQEAGEPFDPDLPAGEASKLIAELQHRVGRSPKQVLIEEQTDG